MADLDETTPEEPLSRRDAIEAAFNEAESAAAPPEAPQAPTVPPEGETQAEREERLRDQKGRFQKTVTPRPKPGTVTGTDRPLSAKQVPSGTKPPAPGEVTAATAQALKPPSSWKPAAREKWAALPPEVQAEAARVDREVRQTMQESADARKNWDAYNKAIAPYAGMIAAEGSNPIQAAANLMQTAHALRTAPPALKAQYVAKIITDYAVDINHLAQALDRPGQPAAAPQAQQQFRDPRFDQFLGDLEQQKRQREAAVLQESAAEVEGFMADAEFGDDVRQDMADLMDLAARRNRAMSVEEAYALACKQHPEVSQIVEQRERAKAANANLASTQRQRAAAVSVRSRPAGPAVAATPTSDRRALLSAAWDQHMGDS